MKHLSALVVFLGASSGGWPCCAVSPGEKVVFAGQTNLVIWDAATKTEHFIRDARFAAKTRHFGFIAPSPSEPELVEVDPEAFEVLSRLEPIPAERAGDAAKSASAGSEVEVVKEQDVAGYRAAVLKATDARALSTWLRSNGYRSTPGVEAWLKPYVAKGWYLTAFKVKNDAAVSSTGTVRMTFKADRPFNPYAVPSDNVPTNKQAGLKLFFVSTGRFKASLAEKPWKAPAWEADVPAKWTNELQGLLKLKSLPGNLHVATYHDFDFPSSGSEDLFFDPVSTTYNQGLVVGILAGLAASYGLARLYKR